MFPVFSHASFSFFSFFPVSDRTHMTAADEMRILGNIINIGTLLPTETINIGKSGATLSLLGSTTTVDADGTVEIARGTATTLSLGNKVSTGVLMEGSSVTVGASVNTVIDADTELRLGTNSPKVVIGQEESSAIELREFLAFGEGDGSRGNVKCLSHT